MAGVSVAATAWFPAAFELLEVFFLAIFVEVVVRQRQAEAGRGRRVEKRGTKWEVAEAIGFNKKERGWANWRGVVGETKK